MRRAVVAAFCGAATLFCINVEANGQDLSLSARLDDAVNLCSVDEVGQETDIFLDNLPELTLTTGADSVTVNHADFDFACVLQELSSRGEITISAAALGKGEDALPQDPHALPFYDGIRDLLEGFNYILIHGETSESDDGAAAAPVAAVRVLSSEFDLLATDGDLDSDAADRQRPDIFADAGQTTSVAALTDAALNQANPADRLAALQALTDRNRAGLQAALSDVLDDWGPEADDIDPFRDLVLDAIGLWGSGAPADVLAAIVMEAPTAELRLEALALLGQASQEVSADAFRQALRDPHPDINGLALDFFEGLDTWELTNAMTAAVQDRDPEVRHAALITLEDMQSFVPVGNIAELAATDPDPGVRMSALELLLAGDPAIAQDSLNEALSDPNPQVSELALDLLGELPQDISN